MVGPNGRLKNRDGGLDVFELLRRCNATGCQFGLTLDLGLSALELSAIPLKGCLALRELRQKCTIIEGEEEVALVDLLAFLEMDLGNLTIDPRLDDHR